MEEKLQELADNLTNELMTQKYGERFLSCEDITEDEDMDSDWEYLNEKIFGSLWAAADIREEKTTYALTFSIEFDKEKLDKMSDEEKYELASVASTIGYTDILSPEVLSYKLNEDLISTDYCWIYFVTL